VTGATPRHVVVCGGGVVGASVAYFLTLRGVAVTVVERTAVACAASGKSGGFLALDWCDSSPLGPLARASFTLHARLAGELGTDYGYRRVDTFAMAAREQGDVRFLGALGSTDTTAQVHPARFTTALIDAARARGAALRIGVVQGVVQRDGVARGVTVDGVTLEADAVVLALGPWTSRVALGLRLPRVYGLKGSHHPRRRGCAAARAVRRLPHGRRSGARARDLSAAGRRGLRVRDGRSATTAGVGGWRAGG
jgi:glycine/D-amino acid oxidase-like deaminating enzyme